MGMRASQRCICTGDEITAGISLHDITAAVAIDDLDRAIEAGLLRWNGCIACALASGSSKEGAEQLYAARKSRLSALAARERYRVRQHRLEQRGAQHDARRNASGATSPQPSALPSDAAAALARAKAKAAARAKS